VRSHVRRVYDALAAFTDKGVIRRIRPAGSPAGYENRVGDNHHHLICRTCNRMVDVDCAVGYTLCLTATDPSGYEIDEAETTGANVPSVSQQFPSRPASDRRAGAYETNGARSRISQQKEHSKRRPRCLSAVAKAKTQ
jgi:hypothetical protein